MVERLPSGSAGRARLLTSTGPLLLSPLGWVMDAIADAGYAGAEVVFGHNPETRDADTILGYADEAGLEVPVVHGPYMVLLRNVLGRNYVEKTRRSLGLADELGADVMVAHAPFRWERRALGWLRREAAAEAAEHRALFAMENLFPVGGRAFSAAITPEDLSAYEHLVFDTSHFAVAGIDLFEAWDAVGDRVRHIHLSDNFGHGKDSHAPIGSGTLPIERFIAHIGRSGYAGTITLEMDCRSYLDARDSLVSFLARERVKVEALLDGEVEPVDPEPLRT